MEPGESGNAPGGAYELERFKSSVVEMVACAIVIGAACPPSQVGFGTKWLTRIAVEAMNWSAPTPVRA